MRHCYARLTDRERFHIKTRLDAGDSMRSIAGALRRSPSTVAREVRRNVEPKGYCALAASRKAAARQRGKSPPRRMTPDTVALVNALLRIKWSPERITGFLRLILGLQAPCPVTIYEHVRRDRLGGGRLFNCLRHGGRRRKSRWTSRYEGRIPNRADIDERPAVVDVRTRVGDWEADLVMGAGHRGAIVTALERRTGLLLAKSVRRKTADATARALLDMLRPHRGDVRTLTFDNGREFSQHERIARSLGCDCYFAKPYHSWEKGAVENVNGLLRQYFPKRLRLDRLDAQALRDAVADLNNRPRKRLEWDSPLLAYQRETQKGAQMDLWYTRETKRTVLR